MERKETNSAAASHQLVLYQRSMLDLDGVLEVAHFDELSIEVNTTMGRLSICGRELHIRQLNLEVGSLSIEGQVDSLTYRDVGKRGGLLGRILR